MNKEATAFILGFTAKQAIQWALGLIFFKLVVPRLGRVVRWAKKEYPHLLQLFLHYYENHEGSAIKCRSCANAVAKS
jgi:hypothetical protein